MIQTKTFSMEARDVVQAALDFTQPQRRKRRLILGAILGTVLVIGLCPVATVLIYLPEYADWILRDFYQTLEEHGATLGLAAAAMAAVVLSRQLLWRNDIYKQVRSNPDQYRDLHVTFGDPGIDITWPNASSHTDWAFYRSVIESREFFLLTYGSLYVALPKRAMDDPSAVATMLREHIPEYVVQS
jgi:YcxB-like protein